MKIIMKDININYMVKGEGSNILLLHGWGANIKLFEKLIDHLSHHHKVYAVDMPGFGESDEPSGIWNVDDYADFVLEFMHQMGMKETVLLGHSFGGRVIIKMVTRTNLPVKISKIVLVDSAGIKPKKTAKQKLRVQVYKLGRLILGFPPVKALYPDALENYRKSHGSADYNAASPVMRQVLVKVVNEDLEYLLPKIKQPALLIWGDKDTATPLSDGQKMEQLIPGAGLVTLEGAGHYSFLERPVIVNRVLDSFLSAE